MPESAPVGGGGGGWSQGGWGAVCSGGVSAPRGGGCLLRGCGIPACTEADPFPVNRITDTSKNITLATTSLRLVKKLFALRFARKTIETRSVFVNTLPNVRYQHMGFPCVFTDNILEQMSKGEKKR